VWEDGYIIGWWELCKKLCEKTNKQKVAGLPEEKKKTKNTRGKLDLWHWNVVAPFWWSRNGLFLLLCEKIPSLKWHSLGIDRKHSIVSPFVFVGWKDFVFVFWSLWPGSDLLRSAAL
jgi:hypothetical protein